MNIEEILESYNVDTMHRMQSIFASVFVLQNRMQTAGEKLQTQISMKQWLLLTMAMSCPEPRTLTNVGKMMGCSRQNVKKLAVTLEKQGFICLKSGSSNSVQIELTDKIVEYSEEVGAQQLHFMELLFEDFSEKEIETLFLLYKKLYAGMERAEKYAEEIESLEERK